MFRVILQSLSLIALVSCAPVSENSLSSSESEQSVPNPLDALVENPFVDGVFYVLKGTVELAERGSNYVLGFPE